MRYLGNMLCLCSIELKRKDVDMSTAMLRRLRDYLYGTLSTDEMIRLKGKQIFTMMLVLAATAGLTTACTSNCIMPA